MSVNQNLRNIYSGESDMINTISNNQYMEMIEEKNKQINEINNSIMNEISKIVICRECRLKFANKGHYIRHITLSELHKKNTRF